MNTGTNRERVEDVADLKKPLKVIRSTKVKHYTLFLFISLLLVNGGCKKNKGEASFGAGDSAMGGLSESSPSTLIPKTSWPSSPPTPMAQVPAKV